LAILKYTNNIEALTRCAGVLKVFAAPANRLALEHEFRWASKMKADDWTLQDTSYFPFPLIHACIVTALFYIDEFAFSVSSLHDIMRVDNNDGSWLSISPAYPICDTASSSLPCPNPRGDPDRTQRKKKT
jgi:hypothetical protein